MPNKVQRFCPGPSWQVMLPMRHTSAQPQKHILLPSIGAQLWPCDGNGRNSGASAVAYGRSTSLDLRGQFIKNSATND